MGGKQARTVTHLEFRYTVPDTSRKTLTYDVLRADSGVLLGQVRWYAHWRRYALYPEADRVFDRACLIEITTFIDGLMAKRRAMRKADA